MKHDPDAGHRALFEDAVTRLDPATANRLRLLRRRTLSSPRPRPARWVRAAAFAGVLLALGLGWRFAGESTGSGTPPAADADLALDLASDEDAALYAWLGEGPVAAAEGKAL